MESLHASCAADVKMPAQIEKPSPATSEGADGVKVKTERCAEQQVNLESQQKGGQATDDLWLQVKTEIKEEIEDDMRSSSFDFDPHGQDVQVKNENAEEQHPNLTSCGYEVATEEMAPEQGMIPARSQAAAESEAKPAKRRRLTRRDWQKTLQTEGLSSAKKELPDGAKVKTERCAEQQVNLESPQRGRMEMDELWLRVQEEIRKQSSVILAASSQAAEKDSVSSEARASCRRQQEPSEHSTEDMPKVVGHEDFAAEESSLDAFASQAATWAKQCLAFRSSKTWSPTRPCCPANLFLGSAIGTPSPPPPDAPACVLRLSGHGLQCLQRFHGKHSLCKTPFESEVEASEPCLQKLLPKPPSDCDSQTQDYKVRGLDCMKMWPWMRDLPTSVWAGHGWAFDENGLRRLSSSGGSHAMQGVEVFESVGLAAEEVEPTDEKITETPAAVAPAENPPPVGGQKPTQFKRINVAKQSGVPNVIWQNNTLSWCVHFHERDAKGQKTRRTGRVFAVKNFIGPGISEAQADAAALEAAKAFRAELVEKGILSEPKQKDPNFTSEVPGVKWDKRRQKWKVEFARKGSGKKIYGGYFTEKAAAETQALELMEKGGLQRQVRPVATLANRYAGLPVFHPKVPYPGVSWEQRSQQWRAYCRGQNFYIRPRDHSEAELERSFQVAVAWKKKQEKEKEGKAVKSRVKPGTKRRK